MNNTIRSDNKFSLLILFCRSHINLVIITNPGLQITNYYKINRSHEIYYILTSTIIFLMHVHLVSISCNFNSWKRVEPVRDSSSLWSPLMASENFFSKHPELLIPCLLLNKNRKSSLSATMANQLYFFSNNKLN